MEASRAGLLAWIHSTRRTQSPDTCRAPFRTSESRQLGRWPAIVLARTRILTHSSLATFDGPTSAPPTPSVISVTHPSQFIHTHHPRRGSLTPLGLNVISPVAPQLQALDGSVGFSESGSPFGSSPMRTVGFHALDGSAYSLDAPRRDSVATVSSSASKTSVASNLTATRPGHSSGVYRRSSLTPSLQSLPTGTASSQQLSTQRSTPLFDPSRRRGSLTPSLPTLSAPAPTRALVAGRLVAKSSASDLPIHAHTADVLADKRGTVAALQAESRRGSLPQLYYGAWTTPGDQRDSGESDPGQATIRRGFKFGSINSAEQDHEGAAGSLQRIAQLSSAKKSDPSAFEEAEQAEAERQRRAFLAATYGEEGRRARARLSLGGNSATASPASPASTRRQSLVLWERIKGSASSSSAGHGTPGGPSTTVSSGDDLVAIRRPSLPVNIPRTPRADHTALFDDQTVWDNPDHLPDVEDPDVSGRSVRVDGSCAVGGGMRRTRSHPGKRKEADPCRRPLNVHSLHSSLCPTPCPVFFPQPSPCIAHLISLMLATSPLNHCLHHYHPLSTLRSPSTCPSSTSTSSSLVREPNSAALAAKAHNVAAIRAGGGARRS